MRQYVSLSDCFQAFKDRERETQFSYHGLTALFNDLEQTEEDTGEEIEFDVIALCCEYTEYDSIAEFNDAYSEECETLKDIEQLTHVIFVEEYEDKESNEQQRFIVQQY